MKAFLASTILPRLGMASILTFLYCRGILTEVTSVFKTAIKITCLKISDVLPVRLVVFKSTQATFQILKKDGTNVRRPIAPQIKQRVRQLEIDNYKPRAFAIWLRTEQLEVPYISQINKLLQSIRADKVDSDSLEDILKFAANRKAIPAVQNVLFVTHVSVEPLPIQKLKLKNFRRNN